MMRRRLQATNRVRQQNYPRNDVSICKLDTTKHQTMGLEQCLSVKAKSICTGRAKVKLRIAIEDIGKGISLKDRLPNTGVSNSERMYVVYPNENDMMVTTNEKPTRSHNAGKAKIVKDSYHDKGQNAKKHVVIPEPVHVSNVTTNDDANEHVRGNSVIVTTDGRPSRDIRNEASPIVSKMRQTDADDTATCPGITPKLPMSGRCTAENKSSKPEPRSVGVCMFYRRNNAAPASTNKVPTYTPRAKNPNSEIRCKTSMGHYSTTPEYKTARTTKSAG